MRTLDPAAQMSVLVRGGLVTDDGEADDLPVLDAEVVGHDQFVREVGLVVGAVVAGADDRLAVVVDDLLHVHRDVVSNHFLGDPRADRADAVDLAGGFVYVGVVGKGGGGSVDIERVDRCEVLGDWACELGGHDPCSSLLMTCRAQRGPSRTRRVKGESPACPSCSGRVDTPEMESRVSIGAFAAASHLSVKTLRHYHEVGLLEPGAAAPTPAH